MTAGYVAEAVIIKLGIAYVIAVIGIAVRTGKGNCYVGAVSSGVARFDFGYNVCGC